MGFKTRGYALSSPAFAHFGVARGECITLSIGFRTPTLSDIMNELGAYTSEHDLCFQLPDTSPTRPGNPGEITPDALNSVKALIEHSLYDTPILQTGLDLFPLALNPKKLWYHRMFLLANKIFRLSFPRRKRCAGMRAPDFPIRA